MTSISGDATERPIVLVTGAAGFIGMHVSQRLLDRGYRVVGVDSLNDYYDVSLKRARLRLLEQDPSFVSCIQKVEDLDALKSIAERHPYQIVVHLAAQAGVRYSIENPHAYAQANLVGFLNILEECRRLNIRHLLYASSSSVYGGNTKQPFHESDPVDHPVSLYAATKKANELMAHTYSHLFKVPTTGLRFFTVYGPWGRPDMALFKFTRAMLDGEPIDVYNHGAMLRDFTYIDDIVDGIVALLDKPPADTAAARGDVAVDPGVSWAPYQIFNIGNQHPVPLMDFIAELERALGVEAKKNFLPMQPGDVLSTHADVTRLRDYTGTFEPRTSTAAGISKFVDWYRSYYADAN